jgi:hypothetical protein
MLRGQLVIAAALAAAAGAVWAGPVASHAKGVATSVDDILVRNARARGGLEAWQKVERMVWLGHIEPGEAKPGEPRLPFAMHLARPDRTRFEFRARTDGFLRVFDGAHGWKSRSGADGRPQVTAFSKEEAAFAKTEDVIEGPLLEATRRGATVTLDGIDTLEGRRAYRLSLRLAEGGERKVWVDVETNLEARYDRPAQTAAAAGRPIATWYRDWRAEGALQVAHVLETGPAPEAHVTDAKLDRLVIEHVEFNVPFDADTFAMPAAPMRRGKGQVSLESGMPAGMGPSPQR